VQVSVQKGVFLLRKKDIAEHRFKPLAELGIFELSGLRGDLSFGLGLKRILFE
jgi:hypothetical protein